MPTIKIDQFAGIMPRVHPTMLPDSCATVAHNCILKSGKLVPMREPGKVTSMGIRMENGLTRIGDAESIYLWHRTGADEILAWPGVVTIAPSNLASDARRRLFITGETGMGGAGANHPCIYMETLDGNGVIKYDITKTEMAAPVVTVPEPPEGEDNLKYTVFFQTWVDEYGYESAASLPSSEVTYVDGDSVTIAYATKPAGAVKRRIYKVVAGTESQSIQYVAEETALSSGFPEFTFKLKDEDAGEVMPMMQGIPEDLTWMTRVPNDFYVGVPASNLREVRFSEVGVPVSWPDDYAYAVHDDVVGLGVTLNSVFAVTTGMPWVLTGTAPDSMTASVLASPQGCVSARSICVMEGAVFYVSADGVCMLQDGAANVTVLTEQAFSKREWQALHPESAIMMAYDGALHLWFTADRTKTAYLLNLKDGAAAVSTHNEVAKAACVDNVTDKLYFVREEV